MSSMIALMRVFLYGIALNIMPYFSVYLENIYYAKLRLGGRDSSIRKTHISAIKFLINIIERLTVSPIVLTNSACIEVR